MMRPRVYVAGPYSKGDPCQNTHRAVILATELLDLGYAPFVPHLSHFWHTMIPRPYENWMELDFAWICVSDVVVRMPGESSGADREVALAESKNIKVVYSLDELNKWRDEEYGHWTKRERRNV